MKCPRCGKEAYRIGDRGEGSGYKPAFRCYGCNDGKQWLSEFLIRPDGKRSTDLHWALKP